MQNGEREEANRVEGGSEFQVNSVQDMKDPEKSESVKVECSGIDGHLVDNGTKIGEVDPMVKSDGLNDCIKAELDLSNVGPAEICCNGDTGELKPSNGNEISSGVLISNDCPKIDSLGCSIQEGLEKVSLDSVPVGSVVTASDMKEREIAQASNEAESDDSSESEAETSSSSSSSESDSDDEEEKEEDQPSKIMIDKPEQEVDLEEGEILGSDVEKMVSWSDDDDDRVDEDGVPSEGFEVGDIDDDDDVVVGPIKSKNELVVLPPVPPVNVTLQPCHQVSPVGVVLSVVGSQVIVEGSEKHSPLSEGSILWITEKRLPLGLVDEIFGPVKTPYYIVRYNSETEVPSGVQTGTPVGFVPEFVDHVLNDKSLYKKGYDASGENDEELSDEIEFSDDEQEAEYKRLAKMSKRGNNNINNNQGPGNKKKNRRNLKNRENTWTKDQPSAPRALTVHPSQSNQNQSGFAQTVQSSQSNPNQSGFAQTVQSSQSNRNQSGFASNPPILPGGPGGEGAFPQQGQMPSGFMINGMWVNGMQFQQQNMNVPFPTGFQMNGMPWLQQQQNPQMSFHMPSMNPTPWQQVQQHPFDLSQLASGSSAPVNFANGPGNSAWPGGILGPNLSANQAQMMFPGPSPQLPMLQGMQQLNAPQGGQSGNSQQGASFPGNMGARPQFNQGSTGRGRNTYHHRFGGGRGRGRQQ